MRARRVSDYTVLMLELEVLAFLPRNSWLTEESIVPVYALNLKERKDRF